MSTGSTSAPFMSVTLPRCFMFGNLCFVTLIGNGSISLAQIGSTPNSAPASGKPPEPSNRLPSLIVPCSLMPSPIPTAGGRVSVCAAVCVFFFCRNIPAGQMTTPWKYSAAGTILSETWPFCTPSALCPPIPPALCVPRRTSSFYSGSTPEGLNLPS